MVLRNADENGAYIYRFNSSKERVGQVQLIAVLIPIKPNDTINFADTSLPIPFKAYVYRVIPENRIILVG